MYKTKIDWCDSSWNPVTGCFHGCEYCYARGIARRFGLHRLSDDRIHVLDEPFQADYGEQGIKNCPYPYDFDPTFHKYRLGVPAKWSESRTIFVCSMADLFGEWVPDEWIQEVFRACEAAPQHRYLFLTKNTKRYEKLLQEYTPPNMWFGWSQDGPMGDAMRFTTHHSVKTFVSIEPLLRPFERFGITGIDWAIVGAETGNRKGKVVPEKKWVADIASACVDNGIPLFMKESLRTLMGADFRQEYPWRKEGEASE